MAGGIYTNRPFEPNMKCIVFGMSNIIFYLLAVKFSSNGKPNYLLLPLIFIISYVAMAYYDVLYNCTNQLYSGKNGFVSVFDSIFKPQLRDVEHDRTDLVEDQEKIYKKNVYLFHLLFVAPLIGYVGYKGYNGNTISKDLYMILIVVSISVILYHGFRLVKPRKI